MSLIVFKYFTCIPFVCEKINKTEIGAHSKQVGCCNVCAPQPASDLLGTIILSDMHEINSSLTSLPYCAEVLTVLEIINIYSFISSYFQLKKTRLAILELIPGDNLPVITNGSVFNSENMFFDNFFVYI